MGKVRRQVEAAGAQQQESIESRNDALVSLEAEVARAYLQLRGAQSVTQTLQTQIEVAQQTLELTQSQQRNGPRRSWMWKMLAPSLVRCARSCRSIRRRRVRR